MEKLSDEKETTVYTPSGRHSPLKPDKMATTSPFLFFTAGIACLLAFATGAALSWTSPVLPQLNNASLLASNPLGRVITQAEESWIASLLLLGGAFGPLVAGQSADRIGRKRTLLLLAAPFLAAFSIKAFARTVPLFYFARTLVGTASGSVFTVLPMYLGEIAQDHNRGIITCLISVSCASGLLFSYIIGPFLSIQLFSLACLVPVLVFATIFSLFLPETPSYLASINDKAGLERSLRILRPKTSPNQLEKEADAIMKTISEENSQKGGITDLFKTSSTRQGITIIVLLVIFQQSAGINAVLSYMQSIFTAAGSSLSSEASTVVVGAVQVFTTVVTSLIVDKLGRKTLLMMSAAGAALSLTLLGAYFYLFESGINVRAVSWLPVVSLLLYIVSFNLGLGPLPWTVLAELFPSNVRSVASTITSATCFFGGFLVTLFFPGLAALLGMAQSFWLFAVFCLFMVAFIFWKVPETKGRTVQEIQCILAGGKV